MAIYVDPGSVDSIRKGILAALEQPPGSALREHIGEEFLWQVVAAKTAAVYAEVLSQASR